MLRCASGVGKGAFGRVSSGRLLSRTDLAHTGKLLKRMIRDNFCSCPVGDSDQTSFRRLSVRLGIANCIGGGGNDLQTGRELILDGVGFGRVIGRAFRRDRILKGYGGVLVV